METPLSSPPTETGPDSYCVGDAAVLEEVCPLETSRWGVWAVTFPEAMKTKDAMQRNLAAVLPHLKEKWLRWKEQYP